jgi:uncharacterized protein YjbJ (UPF0337 family)
VGKIAGVLDKVLGRIKEVVGSVTGNKQKKAEGRSDRIKGVAREQWGKLKNRFK